MSSQLELKELVKEYKGFRAVDKINIQIQKRRYSFPAGTKWVRKDNNPAYDCRSAYTHRRRCIFSRGENYRKTAI